MITVNTANISNNGLSLNISLTTGTGYLITTGKLWTETSFKDYSLAKDISFKFENINNTETFIITPTEVGLSSFDGVYFLEFESNEPADDECTTCADPLLIVVTNLNQYYRCMTEFILKENICDDNIFSNTSNYANKALTVNLLIEGITQCLELGQFIEAIDLLKKIKSLCAKCSNCKSIVKTSTCSGCNNYTY